MRQFIDICKRHPGFLFLVGALIAYGGTKPTVQTIKLQPIKVDTNGMTVKFADESGEPISNKTVRVYVRDKETPDGLFVERFTFRDFTGDEQYLRGFFMDRNQDVRVVVSDE
ncbi:MAG: hypothetical protein ACI4Q3_00650 [Kiritimatiellia bacterium]